MTQQDYWLKQGETLEQYNNRIAALRGETTAAPGYPTAQQVSSMGGSEAFTGIPVDTLSGKNPPKLPEKTVDNTNYNAINAGITGTTGTTTQAETDLTTAKAEQKTLLDKIKELLGMTSGKTAYKEQLTEEAGINQQEKDIQDLTNQLNSIKAETSAKQLTAEGQPIAMGFITGQQAEIERQNAIKSLTVSAQLQAKQGNLTLALNQIDRAVDFKYQSFEEDLNNKVKQLELIDKYELTPAETARKEELDRQYKAQQEALTVQKAQDKEFESNLVDAMQGGMSNAEVAQARNLYNSGNADQANMLVAQYSNTTGNWSEPYLLGGDYVQKNSKTGEIRTAVNVGTAATITDTKNNLYGLIKNRAVQLFADGVTDTEYQQMKQEIIDAGLASKLEDFEKLYQEKRKFLTPDYLRSLYTTDKLNQAAKDAGFTTGGFLGIGKTADVNAYIEYLMKLIEQYRSAGYSDADILKMMK